MTDLVTARIVPLERLFHLGRFRPAAVQREYQWDEERAERLLREITEAMHAANGVGFPSTDADSSDAATQADGALAGGEEAGEDVPGRPDEVSEFGAESPRALPAFYVGALVLSPNGSAEYEIFDGLQRLTTLTILISVLRDLIDDQAISSRLHTAVAIGQKEFRLRHAGQDSTLRSMVQTAGEAKILRQMRSKPSTPSGKQIFDVTRRFVRLLQRRDESELKALACFILDRVLAGIVETEDQRLARHIFVATNLYGLPLRRDEVFKGQLLSLASDEGQAAKIEGMWNFLCEKVTPASFEGFLTAFDAIERRLPQGADCLGDLMDHLTKRTAQGSLDACLAAISNYALAWHDLENYLRNPSGGPIGNHIWRLGFFKWSEWRPLALHWLERHRASLQDEKHRNKTVWRFAELNRRCMAITLYDFGEEKRAEMFLKALQGAMKRRPTEPFGKSPHSGPLDFSKKVRTTIKQGLSLPIEDYEARRSLMLWYEASLWEDELAPGYLMGASVEHILPEKPDLNAQWTQSFPNVEERYLCHGSIGNLVLVDRPVNAELGNKPFADKKAIMIEKGQFEKYICTSDVAHIIDWNPEVVRKRALQFAPKIWSKLKLPEPV